MINFDSLYVYTAGVLSDGLPTIGMNKVSVPEKYYKVIYKFKQFVWEMHESVNQNIS